MNLKLYEVVNDYVHACDALCKYSDEMDGGAIEDTLDGIKGTLEDKIINVADQKCTFVATGFITHTLAL